ncbi:MAG: NADH-quinone oxidoreductase subunit A [Candidatus Omnitrophica bacterium]|nr:NADH-quinone oxidoreductase subunit A [Candidatus Omnitrophota bacterium]
MSDYRIYLFLALFMIGALVVPVLPIAVARFIAPRKPGSIKTEPYECGTVTEGDVWVQFKLQYYIFAILFVVFDVEALFLFPWAVVFKEVGPEGLIAMVVFIGILTLGLIYAWQEGVLEWET